MTPEREPYFCSNGATRNKRKINMLMTNAISIETLKLNQEIFKQSKIFDRAIKAIKTLPVTYEVITSAEYNDYQNGGIRFMINLVNREVAHIDIITVPTTHAVITQFCVTTNYFRSFNEWSRYLRTNVRKYVKQKEKEQKNAFNHGGNN